MRNFDLEIIPTDNHRMHIYLGKAKQVARNQESTDYRFFVRAIIRHSDLVTKVRLLNILKCLLLIKKKGTVLMGGISSAW